MPGAGFVRLLVLGAFIIPPYLGAVGWILLAGPNAGWLNQVWMCADRRRGGPRSTSTRFAGPGRSSSRSTSFPYVFVFTTSALDLVSSEMEDAANILGAGTWRDHAAQVTLPLVCRRSSAG